MRIKIIEIAKTIQSYFFYNRYKDFFIVSIYNLKKVLG